MAEKKESARTTVILALATLAIGVYILLFGLQTMFYFQARHWAARAPYLDEVPQPLPSTAVSPAQEKNLSFYGMDFDAPWKGIASQQKATHESVVSFKEGPILVFFNPDDEEDIVNGIRDGDPDIYQRYRAVFGANLFPTTYDLDTAVYHASPAELSPFMPRDKMTRVGTLLEWKMAFAANGATSIYTLQTSDMRGLQFGDPSRDRMVVARLFDSHNRQYRMLFTSKAGPGTFPQADINCVLGSLKPAPMPQ